MDQEFDFAYVDQYFHISPKGAAAPLFEAPAHELLHHDIMEEVLILAGAQLQAIGNELPASFVGLSINNLVLTKILFLSETSRLLDLSLTNLVFQIEKPQNYPYFGYKMKDINWSVVPEGNFDSVITESFANYFHTVVIPLVETTASVAKVKSELIWNQFASRLTYIRDYVETNEQRSDVIERFNRIYRMLTVALAPEIFGLKRNPYAHKPRYIDNPYQPGSKLMLRSSCCYYDCRVGGQKCYSCPRLTQSERESIKEKILTASVK